MRRKEEENAAREEGEIQEAPGRVQGTVLHIFHHNLSLFSTQINFCFTSRDVITKIQTYGSVEENMEIVKEGMEYLLTRLQYTLQTCTEAGG